MATTWDPSNKSSTQALSGGNLVATSTGEGTVVATRVLTSLLSYFEVTIITLTGTMAVGLVNRSYSPGTSALLGVTANEMGFRSTGAVEINGVTVATIQTFAASSVIGVAVNAQLGLVWFTTNGTTWNNDVIANQNPVGSVGGISLASMTGGSNLPAAGGSATGAVLTGTFSSGSFAHTPPTGYVSVDGCGATARNSTVPSGADYSTVGGVASVPSPVTYIARASTLGMGRGTTFFSPAGPVTHVSGTVEEDGSPVARTVRVYDTETGQLIAVTTSDPTTGEYALPAAGRALVDVVAKDPTTYQAQVFDNVTPA